MLLLGGTEVHTLSLLRVLVEQGYIVTVCCYYEYDDAVVKEYESAGGRVLLLKRKRNIAARGELVELISLMLRLRTIFSSLKPDILHVQYVAPGFVPIIAGRLAGIHTILATVHTAGKIAYGVSAKLLLRISAMFCSHFISVSKSAGEFWFGRCDVFDPASISENQKQSAIYNGVDAKNIQKVIAAANKRRLRQKLQLRGKKVIGTVGRLVELKGYSVLLEAMRKVAEENPAAVLVIIGDGPNRNSLEQKAEDLGIAPRIRWLGEQSQRRVFELLGIMDVFVTPSFYEGFGLTAAEAMSAGLPVVASDVDGLREVVGHDVAGLLVPAGNASAFAHALLTMLQNPKTAHAMGRAGEERVKRCFSYETFAQSYAMLYQLLHQLPGYGWVSKR
jgi:glycosyltransferase involved in cell wall biosynthesis